MENRTLCPEHHALAQQPAEPLHDLAGDYPDRHLAAAQDRLSSHIVRLIETLVVKLEQDARTDAADDAASSGDAAETAAAKDTAGSEPVLPGPGLCVMVAAGRRREMLARERRRLATDMVFSALRNLDNPDWQHGQPALSRGAGNDGAFLQSLLAWSA